MIMKIRKATRKDASLIISMIRGIAKYEKLLHEVSNTEEMILEKLFGKKRYAEVIFGYEGNTVVGFALYFYNYSTFTGKQGLYLEDLFVLEEFRGKGYGKGLLMELIRKAKEQDCGRMEWVVLNWNKGAIELYNSLGAKPLGEWTTYRLDREGIDNLCKQ